MLSGLLFVLRSTVSRIPIDSSTAASKIDNQMTRNSDEQIAVVHPHKLGELPATAICGNDISSSCLYVSALSIIYAGQYAWVALLLVGGVLFLFRRIYGEVVGALPLNGGAYNALLNTTSKSTASLAACLTLLSYMATAVISASEAMHYIHILWHGLPIIAATIGLLAIFMILTIIGIGESAKVAIFIFLLHLTSLTILALVCVYYLVSSGTDVLALNFEMPVKGSLVTALFFGFSAAMLGISGFESSANFVEEQAPGVFPKTLRNMWIVVTLFNPLMAFLALAVIPMPEVEQHKEALLAHMGQVAGGSWLAWLISINAALVLSGAVLTSFVGVSGLVHRMTLDRCLPQFLLKPNAKGTPYRIAIAFFLLCVSVLLITKGELGALAGVYTISFLSVMVLFGIGNILLKVKRNRLPRPERASGVAILVAVSAVIAALIGNAVMNPAYLFVFLNYLVPTVAVVAVMLYRTAILDAMLYLFRQIFKGRTSEVGSQWLISAIDRIRAQQFVFFSKGDNIASLNRVMQYIRENEHTKRIKIVTILDEGEEIPPNLATEIDMLDRAYEDIEVDFIVRPGHFGPKLIDELSKEWNIPKNFMFIGSPSDTFPYGIQELGGVRLII
jgi:amino acid transporter